MAKVTVCKQSDFTVLDNGIFRDKNLSLKAKGLLATMLSLPKEWNYTIEGLTTILKDGKDSIRSALNELENNGYLVRKRIRNEKGQLAETEYIVYEKTNKNTESLENRQVQPKSENPTLDNPTLLNIYNIKNKKHNSSATQNERDFYFGIVTKAKDITSDSCVISAIMYYLDKYKEIIGKRHPDISYQVLSRFVSLVNELLQDNIDDIKADNGFIKMIDRHFETNYGQFIDYNFPHFATEGVILYQARNCCYIDGYTD